METENKIPLDDRPSATYTKKCSKCEMVKSIEEFRATKRGKAYLRGSCAACVASYKTTPEYREMDRLCHQKYRKKDIRRTMLDNARARSKKAGVPCTITLNDIYLPTCCPIFGTELKVSEKHLTEDSPSLDRVKPELGYIPGNICVISYRANRIKSDLSVEALEAIVNYIHSFDNVKLANTAIETNKETKVEPISQHRNPVG